MIDLLFQPISYNLEIKKETINALKRINIGSLRDLLFYCPSSYKIKNTSPNLSNLKEGELIQAEVIIQEVLLPNSRKQPIKISVRNDTGVMLLIFFNKIPPFIFNRLKVGSRHIISGKAQYFDYYWQISHPEFITKKELESNIEPIYPLTYGIVNKQIYSYIIQAIGILEKICHYYSSNSQNIFDKNLAEWLVGLMINLKRLHFYKLPTNEVRFEEIFEVARKNLAKLELIANQISLALVRNQKKQRIGHSFSLHKDMQKKILSKLGFQLTSGQINVVDEIELDQKSEIQMMRLLQGDVGSGKTLVALLTMVNVVCNKKQASLMAPTDLLANQHYQFFKSALEQFGINVALLTGKTTQKERRIISAGLESGEISILIGTHALFQDKVNFADLGLIVIDEQHRFGVEQRLSLINKSSSPDVLVMTATPIPRSLTLTMFGDMFVSKLASKPADRLPIITTISRIDKVNEIINAITRRLEKGERVYWICPLVEASDVENDEQDNSYMDANSRFETLNCIYPGQVGLVHGKMNAEAKDKSMQKFKEGEVNILVATTVIEVGIDVPEATLIIIENAEKFGLAQLHQLRGRVGRGRLQSYCVLLYNPKRVSNASRTRLEIMRNSNDGFYIAEQDLVLRGSGDILGTKQSGEPEFFFANLASDLNILLEANKLASSIEYTKPGILDLVNLKVKLFARRDTETLAIG